MLFLRNMCLFKYDSGKKRNQWADIATMRQKCAVSQLRKMIEPMAAECKINGGGLAVSPCIQLRPNRIAPSAAKKPLPKNGAFIQAVIKVDTARLMSDAQNDGEGIEGDQITEGAN